MIPSLFCYSKIKSNYIAQSMACHRKIPMLRSYVANSVMDGWSRSHTPLP